MAVISGGSLVSDCCHVLAMCADASCSVYQCSRCNRVCTASESLGEYHDRLEVPKRERQRLERAVLEAAKVLDKKFQWHGDFVGIESARAYDDFKQKMQALNKFETENKVE